jgi:hypothetical protein
MFYYDLLAAHRAIAGDPNWSEELPTRLNQAEAIPWAEATRLLFNRGSSLYFARHALAFDTARAHDGYVPRIQGKILLALADAVLVTHGLYHFSCRERNRRLAQVSAAEAPASWGKLKEWHARGVEFKFHPHHEPLDRLALLARHEEILALWREVFLWIEGRRLGRSFGTLADYARSNISLVEGAALKAVAQRLRDHVKYGTHLSRWREPGRAVLLRVLALLQQEQVLATDQSLIAEWLGLSTDADAMSVHEAYRRWWSFYQ